MAAISHAAESEIKKLLVSWWTAVNQQLSVVTGASVQIGDAPIELLVASEIGQRLVRIAAASEGLLAWTDKNAAKILADCRAFEEWLNQTPIIHRTPEEFWATPVGYMVLCAQVWASKDRLISLSEAAEQSGMSLSVLSQRISRGQIMGYRDPLEKNPQRARRIRLSDLNLLLQQGIVRKPFTASGLIGQSRLEYSHPNPEIYQKST